MLPHRALDELHEKYAEMLAMRLVHEAGDEDPGVVRARMAALASRFPGALREIDELELDEIRGRLSKLADARHRGGPVEPWMEAIALFHTLARGALCAKRWLNGSRRVDDDLELRFAAELGGLAFPDDARAWQGGLAELAQPPGGRITRLVFARVARTLRTDEASAKRLVFSGRPRVTHRGGGP